MTMLRTKEPFTTEVWTTLLPRLAFEHDALLYSMFSISALHLAKTESHESEAIDAYQKYLDLALREHFNDVTHLSKDNADAACLTSSIVRLNAFAVLQERPLDPYTPPTQWLETTCGAGKVFAAAWKWIKDDEDSIAMRLVRTEPILMAGDTLFGEPNRLGLLHLLRRSRDEDVTEPWLPDIQEAYESTVSLIGSYQMAIAARGNPEDIFRKLILFPILVPKRFIDLVEKQQPRALVVLGHYFSLVARVGHTWWWCGDTGRREVRGIQTVLSDKWLGLMSWSLRTMEESLVLA